jgi:hypothetical protein
VAVVVIPQLPYARSADEPTEYIQRWNAAVAELNEWLKSLDTPPKTD